MKHVPVLLQEVLKELALNPNDNVVDCTLGDGGHSFAMLQETGPKGILIGIDADPESLMRAKHVLNPFQERTLFFRSNFENLRSIVQESGIEKIDAVLADLGWSSPQFVERGRGFSFTQEADLLDMRYDGHLSERMTAADILHTYSEEQLYKMFKKYGEEPLSHLIAAAVVEARKEAYIETVKDFVDIVLGVYRKKLKSTKDVPWIGGLHPATKVFQALRIEVNDELGVVERLIESAMDILSPNGKLAIITFHSIEDRIVKHEFKRLELQGKGKILTKKPIGPSQKELQENKRASSAKLRLIQKN